MLNTEIYEINIYTTSLVIDETAIPTIYYSTLNQPETDFHCTETIVIEHSLLF